jgi:glycosyltransferase involved in cell wall biosynthesis
VRTVGVARSDGAIERARVDVMHFTFQSGFLTAIPSIYQPWDLQHVHLPQFFTPRERLARDVVLRALCDQARLVVAASSWVRNDLAAHFSIPDEKLALIPAAPVLTAYPKPTAQDLDAARDTLGLPDAFLFYPSQTWPHKNHIRLLEAVALLRHEGIDVSIVCSGAKTDFFHRIEETIRRLRLAQRVRFVGFVSPLEIQCLYRLARGVVLPTRFEGWGMPLMEAFAAGAPVACSRVTSFPELAGDAALFFDPDSVAEIGEAMSRVWNDAELRRRLADRGRRRVESFTWDRVAQMYRAHYRRLGGHRLGSEDEALITSSLAS